MFLPTKRTPCVTNIHCAVQKIVGGAGRSVATLQATGPVRYSLNGPGNRYPSVCLDGVCTRIPDNTIPVFDGLLDRIRLADGADRMCLSLELAHPTALAVRAIPGMPFSLNLELDRQPLWRIMRGRRILVDPGHGGEDAGGKGPIDLLEKRMTLAVTQSLADELAGLGAEAILTRSDDIYLSLRERLELAERHQTGAMISLHTAWFLDPAVAGIRVVWLNQNGQGLAQRIHAALRQKLPLPDRGLAAGTLLSGLAQPSVAVEFATISNPVEEGWLRSSTFLQRAAVAVANGLTDFFGRRVISDPNGAA